MVMIREGMRDIPAMKGQLDGLSDAAIIAISKFTLIAQPYRKRALEINPYLKRVKLFQKRLYAEPAIYQTMLVEIRCHGLLGSERITCCIA
jgi:hypothetical protein